MMKMLNIDQVPIQSRVITTQLLIMPQETGVHFAVVNVSRQRPKKKVAILRYHFEPWTKGPFVQIQNREITAVIKAGCRQMAGDDHDITSFYHRFASGVRAVDFEAACICMPADWSHSKTAHSFLKKSRYHAFSARIAQRVNARNFSGLPVDPQRFACLDARASYLLDDRVHLHEPSPSERFYNLAGSTTFVFVERDKCSAITAGLQEINHHLKRISWTSDLCPSAQESDTVLVDICESQTMIHWNLAGNIESHCMTGFGRYQFLLRLRQRLGLLESPAENVDSATANLFFKLAGTENPPELENFNFDKSLNCTPSELQKTVSTNASEFWAPFFEVMDSKSMHDKKISITGDSPTTIYGLCRVAAERHWQASICWPDIEYHEINNAGLPARLALRAKGIFSRSPFFGVPMESPELYNSRQAAEYVLAQSTKAASVGVCFLAKALSDRISSGTA